MLVPAVRNKIVVGNLGNQPDSRFKRWQAAAICRASLLPDRRCGDRQPLPLKRLHLSNFGRIWPKYSNHPAPIGAGMALFARPTPHTDRAGKCVFCVSLSAKNRMVQAPKSWYNRYKSYGALGQKACAKTLPFRRIVPAEYVTLFHIFRCCKLAGAIRFCTFIRLAGTIQFCTCTRPGISSPRPYDSVLLRTRFHLSILYLK